MEFKIYIFYSSLTVVNVKSRQWHLGPVSISRSLSHYRDSHCRNKIIMQPASLVRCTCNQLLWWDSIFIIYTGLDDNFWSTGIFLGMNHLDVFRFLSLSIVVACMESLELWTSNGIWLNEFHLIFILSYLEGAYVCTWKTAVWQFISWDLECSYYDDFVIILMV